ncbi:MAG TPA: pilus assembly protein TadG-related protein [Actinoallomurus sp.]|jgi:cell wall-associated NlpC family hydrolase
MKDERDKGAATMILVVGTALVLVAATMLLSRIGQADDLRTRAQSAADSAALGAEEALREHAVDQALEGVDPRDVAYWSVDGADEAATRAAERYASLNSARLTGKVRLSGALGRTARADVVTRDCRPEHSLGCGGAGGSQGATATAVARLDVPSCVREADPARLTCAGVQVWPDGDAARVRGLFHLRLVDQEDAARYPGGATGVQPVPDAPAGASGIAQTVLAYAYARLGTPYHPSQACPDAKPCDIAALPRDAYAQAGVSIPATAAAQLKYGPVVAAGDEQPGDLVFYGDDVVGIVVDPASRTSIGVPKTGAAVTMGTYRPGDRFARPAQHR